MKNMKLPKLLFRLYLTAVLVFGFFRFLLFYRQKENVLQDNLTSFSDILSSFLWGLRFDALVTGFIVIIPFLLLLFYETTHKSFYKKSAFWIAFILFSLAFMLSAANVVYYHKFYQFITVKSIEWFDQPAIVFGMIFQEPRYWFMFIPFILVIYFYFKWLKQSFKIYQPLQTPFNKRLGVFLLLISLIFVSIRGRLIHAPLRAEDAFTLHNNFLNELKLNPVFVLEKSYENYLKDKLNPLNLMPVEQAIKIVQKDLNITKPVNKNPISRQVSFDTLANKKNVVLVLMESMGAWKMRYFGNQENRTPFLDSLFLKSISFTNMYSNGIHTYSGIYGTLFAYPDIFDNHPLKGVKVKQYAGLSYILKKNAYKTIFFLPHSKDFDNTGSFLTKNAFDRIYFEKDYDKKAIRNIWGVDDHYLLDFALNKIDSLAVGEQPFFATVLTISDHGPFYIPDFIKGETDRIRATRFADWSVNDFMRKAQKKPWFDSTIFVFVADHGEGHKPLYPIPLTYNHIPALIYYRGVQPKIIDKMAGQVDILPAIMQLLNIDYLNQTFGKNMFTEARPYIYFNHDEVEALIDKTHLLLIDKYKTIGLYHYRNKDLTNYMDKEPEKRKEMEAYLKAHLQTTKYILDNDLQAPQ